MLCFKHFMRYRHVLIPHLLESVQSAIAKGEITAKRHAGRINPGNALALPDELVTTIKAVLKDSLFKNVRDDADTFYRKLKFRQSPISNEDIIEKRVQLAYRIRTDEYDGGEAAAVDDTDDGSKSSSNRRREEFETKIKTNLDRYIADRSRAWKPITYTTYIGKMYLAGRMAAEYAVLNKIFLEITQRCPDFQPHSLFDFGSGVGTVTWVARKYWQDSLKEYFCVDVSAEMNELAKLVLQGGNDKAPLPINNLYFRQFLPPTTKTKYSLVTCSYTLLELPSAEERLKTIMKLWNKTEDFLVVIEHGNRHGFEIIVELRHFILQSYTWETSNDDEKAYVFSPCAHEVECPRRSSTNKFCFFQVPYMLPNIAMRRPIMKERYSYVVLRKGQREENDEQWSRVVAPVQKKKHRAHCQICTKEGKLQNIMFSKCRNGLIPYHVGRSVKFGDRLPIEISEIEVEDDGTEAGTNTYNS